MTRGMIFRFPHEDDKKAFVIVRIATKGPGRLDLKLVGTEGELQYAAVLKHSQVDSLRVKNCPVSESEWVEILQGIFTLEYLRDIKVTATLKSESSISLTVRKETQGITQRLGVITLNYDEKEVIELFDWCGQAAQAADAAREGMHTFDIYLSEKDAVVTKLRAQLEELLQAKKEDEEALLRKFRDLLNEKKVKIREQQRVLASSSVNVSQPVPSQLSQAAGFQASPSRSVKPARQVGNSRASKRKAPASKRIEEESDDEGVLAMEIDNIKEEAEETDPGNTTEATASGVDDDDEDNHAVGPSSSSKLASRKSPAEPDKKPPAKTAENPPAKRDLPFNTRKSARVAAQATSDTESDDEL